LSIRCNFSYSLDDIIDENRIDSRNGFIPENGPKIQLVQPTTDEFICDDEDSHDYVRVPGELVEHFLFELMSNNLFFCYFDLIYLKR
jgi:hypothetical protein